MANQLREETSPYLLQHADNPVDWQPWGDPALERARRENRPIFLSIGYSACHWCHVMAHESFEDAHIAELLNRYFVNIKVDREERPDLDQIYMNAIQMMTGRGGWPLSVFLTPELHPFYGGTYWPPRRRQGMPGFDEIVQAVANAWHERGEATRLHALELTGYLRQADAPPVEGPSLSIDSLRRAEGPLERAFDFTHGGFGSAPKFPHPMQIQLLLRLHHRWPRAAVLDMVRLNLDKMGAGGIYDQLAGGFARYSVDARWLVPHFEKMLYDNGLLANAYLDAFLVTRTPGYAQIVQETLGYIQTYMSDPEGGFHSTEDADSEGEEGKFYLWTPEEVHEILGGERAERFCYVYDVTEEGNFEEKNILNLPKSLAQCASLKGWNLEELERELAADRRALLAARDRRIRPGKDDKILVSWNGLMIDAMARAARVFQHQGYRESAERAAQFILSKMRTADGRLQHTWRAGQAKLSAYLDDYVCLANGLVSLYEATFVEKWLEEASALIEIVLKHFSDPATGDLFYTADDHEALIMRTHDRQDGSVPSSSAMAATVLIRLGRLCGRPAYLDHAERIIRAASSLIQNGPLACGQMLIALDMLLGPAAELVLLGDPTHPETQEALRIVAQQYRPNRVIVFRAATRNRQVDSDLLSAAFAGKEPQGPGPTLFVCENYTCQQPVYGIAPIRDALNG